MPIDTLIHAVHEFLDAEVMREQRRTETGDAAPSSQPFERAERALSDALADASNVPAERSLVVEAEAYLAATVAFEQARTSQVDGTEVAGPARRLERAQQGLQDMLGRYAREATAHDAARSPPARRVLVGVDGSQPSEWAVETAGRLAVDLGASVRLVHVRPFHVDEDSFPDSPEVDRDETDRREGDELLHDDQLRLPDGVESSVVQRWGNAAVEIVNVGRRWGADFIVVGTRGRGRLSRFVLGSTAESVLRLAACPVITVSREPSGPLSVRLEQPAVAIV